MTNKPTDAELIAFAVETGMRVRTGKGVVTFARAVLDKWGQPAPQQEAQEQAGERVYAFRRKGLADFCTCDEARYEELSNKPNLFETRIFYTAPQPAPQQDVSAAGGDSFLLLPTRPTPDAPANTAGLSLDAYSGAQMLAYGRSCSDAALVVAAPQPSPAAQEGKSHDN